MNDLANGYQIFANKKVNFRYLQFYDEPVQLDAVNCGIWTLAGIENVMKMTSDLSLINREVLVVKFEEKAKRWVQNWRIRIASRLVSTTTPTTTPTTATTTRTPAPTTMTTTAATPAVTTGETGATAATPAVTTGECVVDHTDTSGEHTKREV